MRHGSLLLSLFLLSVGIQMTGSADASSTGPGLYEGRLRPCPDRPNCVSSEQGDVSAVAPLSFRAPPAEAWGRLKSSVEKLGGTVVEDSGQYLRATFTSLLFRFVDDVEFRLVPEEGVIHVRSASRTGYSDLGVNRRRVERLRVAFGRNAHEHERGKTPP